MARPPSTARRFADGEAWAGEGAVALAPAQQGVTAWRFEVAEDGAAAGAIGGVSRLKLSAVLETAAARATSCCAATASPFRPAAAPICTGIRVPASAA